MALMPCSLTKLVVSLRTWSIDWETFRSLRCLQELEVCSDSGEPGDDVQLDDSFATALPLLRVLHVSPGVFHRHAALETTAKVVMPHLVELSKSHVNVVHLDLHFMSALNSLDLFGSTISTVSADCSTMLLHACRMREGLVLVTPKLRSVNILGGGLHKLDGSKCRHALSTLCKHSSIEWVGAKPNVGSLEKIEEANEPFEYFNPFRPSCRLEQAGKTNAYV